MDLVKYQQLALRTMSPMPRGDALEMCILGMIGELGEVADLIKKARFHGHEMDRTLLVKELGDLLWYLVVFCDQVGLELYPNLQAEKGERTTTQLIQAFSYDVSLLKTDWRYSSRTIYLFRFFGQLAGCHGISINEIMTANIAKLQKRYPNGFSHEASRNRKEEAH